MPVGLAISLTISALVILSVLRFYEYSVKLNFDSFRKKVFKEEGNYTYICNSVFIGPHFTIAVKYHNLPEEIISIFE